MDFETVNPEDFGASLKGFGLNFLVTDVKRTAAFLESVFGMATKRLSTDFAILTHGENLLQFHADSTYHSNPLLGLLPENPPRGAGLEIRLYECDPEHAAAQCVAAGGTLLQAPADKPHGLREAYILCHDGYAWVPSKPLISQEKLV